MKTASRITCHRFLTAAGLALVALVVLLMTTPALAGVALTLGHGAAPGNPRTIAAEAFAKMVAERTGGNVTITIGNNPSSGTLSGSMTIAAVGGIATFADLRIDFLRHKASRGGKRLDLTPKEFALLSLLARRQGEVLSRSLIADQVWDMNFDSDTNVVDVAVRRLRTKIDDPFELKLIQTVRGTGYVLEER